MAAAGPEQEIALLLAVVATPARQRVAEVDAFRIDTERWRDELEPRVVEPSASLRASQPPRPRAQLLGMHTVTTAQLPADCSVASSDRRGSLPAKDT
jgi:hypothetical protein